MENTLALKTEHLNNFYVGTSYLITKSYEFFSYLYSLLPETPSDEARVDKGLDNLYAVRVEVTNREQTLRNNVTTYLLKAKEFMKKNMKREAKIMIKLYMLYDIQVTHCQATLTAIESHIISLESVSLNKKVCSALKESNYVNGFESIDEDILEDAVEKLDDRNLSTNEFLRTLGDTPSLDINEEMIENELLKLTNENIMETVPEVKTTNDSDPPPLLFPEVPTFDLINTEREKIAVKN